MQAMVVTSRREAKSTAIRKKTLKKQSVKTLLTTPYLLNWPNLPSKDEELICDEIKRVFTSLCLNKPTKPDLGNVSNLTIKEKNALKKHKLKETWSKSKKHRRHLTFGLQQAIRCLEKNELCALLLCRDVKPFMMIEGLLPLAASRCVSSAAIHNLGSTLQKALNFKSCRALGFKEDVARNDKNVFHNLFELIKRKALQLPTLFDQPPDISSELFTLSHAITANNVLKSSISLPATSEKITPQDYSHLYVKKCDVKPLKVPIEGEFLLLERDPNYIAVDQVRKRKLNDSEYISEHLRCKKYKGMKFKQLKAAMAKVKSSASNKKN